MRLRPILAVLALATTVPIGCGGPDARTEQVFNDLRVSMDSCGSAGMNPVTPAAMRSDWDVLERIVGRGYAGYDLAGGELVWNRVFVEGREQLPQEPVSPIEFRDFLVDRLRFADDNHLGFWIHTPEGQRSWRSTSVHLQAYVSEERFARRDGVVLAGDGAQIESCEQTANGELFRPTVGSEVPVVEQLAVVLSETPVDAVRCQARSVEGSIEDRAIALHPQSSGASDGPAFERMTSDVPWLRLRTLFASRSGALDRFVAAAAELRSEPVIVLDFRGVAGGSDRFVLRFLRSLTSQQLPYFVQSDLRSEVTLQGALTFWGCVQATSTTDPGGRLWLQRRVDRARRELDQELRQRGAFRDFTTRQGVTEGQAPEPFRGRLLLVVDRGCASACESAVFHVRHFPGALVVGENTEGTLKVGELRWYRLPHSGVWMSAGTRVHADPAEGNSFPEGLGYRPDLWLDGAVFDDRVADLARCLTDPSCAAELDAALGRREDR